MTVSVPDSDDTTMNKETILPRRSDLLVGVGAGAAVYGLQSVPLQTLLQLYPEELRSAMAVLSSLIVGIAVTVALVLFSDKPVQELKKLTARAFWSLLSATVLLVVVTQSFVVDVDIAGQSPHKSITGMTGPKAECNDINPRPCRSSIECLRYKGMGRDGSMACWGRWQIVFAESLIYFVYIIVVLPLGVLVALLRILMGK